MQTALHELFHALGFSADLFPSFQQCTITGCTLFTDALFGYPFLTETKQSLREFLIVILSEYGTCWNISLILLR